MNTLLNRLGIGQKLAVLGLLGVLLTGVPSALFLHKGYAERSVAQQELSGMEPAILLIDLVRLTQQHRGLSSQVLGGRTDAVAAREEKKREVEQAIAAFEARGRAMLDDAKVAKAWGVALPSWRALESKVSARSISAAEGHTGHTSLIAEQLDVLEHIRDASGLSLDPEADGYFLHLAGLVDAPNLSEQMGQMRSKGVGMLAAQVASEADKGLITSIIYRVRVAQRETSRAIDKAAQYRPQMRTHIGPLLSDAAAKVNKITALAEEQIVLPAQLTFSADQYRTQTTEAIDSVFKLKDALNAELVATINDRSARITTNNLLLAGGILLLALLAGALGVFLARGIKQENDQLNESVLTLLQGVAQLARKDLTAKVTVAEDVTGPVADALNLLASETAKVLQQVSDISADVSLASLKVKQQSDAVQAVADAERIQVDATSESLIAASGAMTRIAELAQTCNAAADHAIKTTQLALTSVTSTVGGINSTRDTIRETEKRIKRLGERSQEISVAVGLINTIAERTHILAINAAMHAASAGEAGRGFAVVADEVQRLAESSRQATQQIAALVGNIQVETADTVTTMNAAISQVVEGSRLAEQAGVQMQDTQNTTAELVASVQRIAAQSQEQAAVSKELIVRAEQSKQSSIKTNTELVAQAEQTGRLVEYAKSLLSAVRVFKLSASA